MGVHRLFEHPRRVWGYQNVSQEQLFWPASFGRDGDPDNVGSYNYRIKGQTVYRWSQPTSMVWSQFERMIDTYDGGQSPPVVLVQLCEAINLDHQATYHVSDYQELVDILTNLRAYAPTSIVYLSTLDTWGKNPDGTWLCSVQNGKAPDPTDALAHMTGLANQAIDAGLALAGPGTKDVPSIGPLTFDPPYIDVTDASQCHPNGNPLHGPGAGSDFLGQQMADFTDHISGPLEHLSVSPDDATVVAGTPLDFVAEGFDASGNDLGDVTGSSTFSLAPEGSCTGSTCTTEAAGDHTVTATDGAATGTAVLHVDAGASDQTITFGAIPAHVCEDPDFDPAATASSSLPVSYSAVGSCSISGDGLVDVTGVGTCTVTASQAGNASWNPAPEVTQSFPVIQADQTITFDPIPAHTYGDPDFDPAATASSNLPVSYSAVGSCSITVDGLANLSSAGTCTLTASQSGDEDWSSAPEVTQSFEMSRTTRRSRSAPSPPTRSATSTST